MKKLLATILASSMALAAVGGLVACGENETPAEIPATGITLSRTEMSIAPDASKGIAATLTPLDSNTQVVWTSSDEKKVTVKTAGGNATTAMVYAWDSGEVTLTATAGEYKATCTVTVTEWARYMLVGAYNGWDAASTDTDTFFQQDATDLHKWTITLDMEKDSEFKINPVRKNSEGVWSGIGWAGEDFGCDKTKDNATVTATGDTINTAGGDNIKVVDSGNYTFTLQMKVGGGIDSLTYVRNGDMENPPEEEENPVTAPTEMSTLMLVGTVGGENCWGEKDEAGARAFTKATSGNTYTLSIDLDEGDAIKIIDAGLNSEDVLVGMGWGGHNIGVDGEQTEGKTLTSTSGTLSAFSDSGVSGNINVEAAGNYTITVVLDDDGNVTSVSYVYSAASAE